MQYPLVISWPTSKSCYEVGIGNVFTSAAFWQWSVTGSCPGVSGEVDLDRFNGTLAQLQQLAVGSGAGGSGGVGGSGGGGGSPGHGGSGGTGGGGGGGGSPGHGGSGGTGGRAGAGTMQSGSSGGGMNEKHGGCSCTAGEREETPVGAAVLMGIAGVIVARRRRSTTPAG